MVTIYHNPRCSKSRATLALLEAQGIVPKIVNYLENPLNVAQLQALVGMLGCPAQDIIRTSEATYRQLGLHQRSLPESELLAIVANNPHLLQRPIVVHGGRAVLGRPPQNVLTIL